MLATFDSAGLNGPQGLALGPNGEIVVADTNNNRLAVLAANGTLLQTVDTFSFPNNPAVDADGSLYIANYESATDNVAAGTVIKFFSNGSVAYTLGPFYGPKGVAVDDGGVLYVANQGGLNVYVAATGQYVRGVSDDIFFTADLAIDSHSNFILSDYDHAAVVVVANDGSSIRRITNPAWVNPTTVAVDADDNIYMSDSCCALIYILYNNGSVLSEIPISVTPGGLVVDPLTNDIYAIIGNTITVYAGLGAPEIALSSSSSSSSSSTSPSSTSAELSSSSSSALPTSSSSSSSIAAPVAVSSSSSSSAPVRVSSSSATALSSSTAAVDSKSSSSSSSPLSTAVSSSSTGSPSVGSSSSSVTAPAGVVGDPQFVGLLGQSFQVHGIDGAVYSLIIDRGVLVNARFRYLSSGRCPQAASHASNCWSHPGSYLGEVGVVSAEGDRLHVVSGDWSTGFDRVTLDGAVLSVPSNTTRAGLDVQLLSAFELRVRVGNWELLLHNSDRFVNVVETRVSHWSELSAGGGSHGLLGQTWRLPREGRRGGQVQYIEGDVDEYVEQNNDILGGAFLYGLPDGEDVADVQQ